MADKTTNINPKVKLQDQPTDWRSWMKKAKVDYAIYQNEKGYTSPTDDNIIIKLDKIKQRMTHVKYFSIIYELTFMLTMIL